MRLRLSVLLRILVITALFFQAAEYGNAARAFGAESIVLVNVSPTGGVSGTEQKVDVRAFTMNVADGSLASAALVDQDGVRVEGTIPANGTVRNGLTDMFLTIPAQVPAGNYRIKVAVHSISNMNTSYTITPEGITPYISGATYSPTFQDAGVQQTVVLNIKTTGVKDSSPATVTLTDSSGKAVEGVSSSTAQVKDNSVTASVLIPAFVTVGEYRFRIQVEGVPAPFISDIYRISVGSPVINEIITSGANLVEGSIKGYITINGDNFSEIAVDNIISVADSQGNIIATSITPTAATKTSLTVAVPQGLVPGSYKIRVYLNGKTAISSTEFTVSNGEPVIDSLSFSTDVKLIEGSIYGSIIIKGKSFSNVPTENIVQVTDLAGNIKSTLVTSSATNTQLIAAMPNTLGQGEYRIRVVIKGKAVVGTDSFTISPAIGIPVPQITGIDTSGTSLTAGNISGSVVISGLNFSGTPAAEIVDENNQKNYAALSITSFTTTRIIGIIPSSLTPGSYFVRVNIGSLSAESTQKVTIFKPVPVNSSNPQGNIPTPPPVLSPPVAQVIGGLENAGTALGNAQGEDVKPVVDMASEEIKKAGEKLPEINNNEEKKTVLNETAKTVDKVSNSIETLKQTAEMLDKTKKLINDVAVVIKNAEASGVSSQETSNALVKAVNTIMEKVSVETLDAKVEGNTAKIEIGKDRSDSLIGKMDEIIQAAKDLNSELSNNVIDSKVEAVLEIKAQSAQSVTMSETSVPAELFSAASSKKIARIAFSSSVATIKIIPDVINSKPGENIVLKAKIAENSDLTQEQAKVVGNSKVYDFSISSGENRISTFAKPVEVSIPYTLKQGEDPEKVTAFYINENGKLENVIGIFNEDNNCVEFTTTHFSKYFIKSNDVSFKDVENVKWAKTYIEAMAAKGVVQGVGEGNFNPSGMLTRAQFAAMIVRAFKLNDNSAESSFSDVNKSVWYYKDVSSAVKSGIIAGRGNGKFAPDEYITRQDMAVLISRLLQAVKGKGEISVDNKFLDKFGDNNNISDYARKGASMSVKYSIIGGTGDGAFAPKSPTTRAQAAIVIYRLFKL